MRKKPNLPIFDAIFARARDEGGVGAASGDKKKPSLAVARARLGGTAEGVPAIAAGTVVDIPSPGIHEGPGPAPRETGVVVFSDAVEAHVLFDARSITFVRIAAVAPFAGEVPSTLDAIAADARVFGSLATGQSVRYMDGAGTLHEGKLAEKCRYGALVARLDGAIVAVGFRKLWPVPDAAEA